jgi:2',3'-cyclic-nucleotide 2'-phosphodiesterase
LPDAGRSRLRPEGHAPVHRTEPRILRPLNFRQGRAGQGRAPVHAGRRARVLVAQVLGQVFMKRPFDDPFSAIEPVLKRASAWRAGAGGARRHALRGDSEKMAMGHWCDGRASLVVGTHTHVPTADAQILPGGTASSPTPACAATTTASSAWRRTSRCAASSPACPKGRFEPATGRGDAFGVFVETDDRTGRAQRPSRCASAGGFPRGPRREPARA